MNALYSLLVSSVSLVLLMLAAAIPVDAEPGDTTTIRLFDNYLWTWNGGQNRWGVFPGTTHRYERVLMHYRLKCPTGGCGEWDYTTNVYIMYHTGQIDSSLQTAPSFRVNGGIVDSVAFSTQPTFRYTYNTTKKKTDTTENTQVKITKFEDAGDVWKQTDSMMVWPAGYYNPIFDAAGSKIDSIHVAPETVLHVTKQQVYVPFEVIVPYEIGRFITPYGKLFPKDREFDWVFDVTDYAFLLHDSVEIRTFYDGWSQGSLYSLDFEVIEGVPPVDVYKVENLYTGGFSYGNPDNPIENHLTPKTITVDQNAKHTWLKLTTSGHGFGGTDNAAEFSEKTHWVEVNGTRRFDQFLWRNDCGQNPISPQAGTWQYNRAGWCPGDIVHPFVYDLTPYVTPGQQVTVDYNMQPYVNADLSHPASYIIQAQVLYAGEANFANEVRIEEIRKPNSAYMYRRMNPLCSDDNPVIVIRNTGGTDLTSLKINYGTGGSTSHSYNWTGKVKFMDTAVILLPGIDLGSTDNTFTVTLSEPNGVTDEYSGNNTMSSSYKVSKRSSGVVYLTMRTDDFQNHPLITNGISYKVVDLAGNTLYDKADFADGTIYRDTFRLNNGCYHFIIYDSYLGDGLLALGNSVTGSYLLKDDQGRTIINGSSGPPEYLAGFGDREIVPFTVTSSSGVNEEPSDEQGELLVYPNPTNGLFTVEFPQSVQGKGVTVQAYSASGEEIFSKSLLAAPLNMLVDFSGRADGIYMVKVTAGDVVWGKKVVVGRK
jgi:hypothetical protein